MSLMVKIAIGTFAVTLAAAAAAVFVFNVPEGLANATSSADAVQTTLRPSTGGTTQRLEVAQAAAQPATNQTSTLPGGASSLQENYQDWGVMCAQQPGANGQPSVKRCAMTQQQVNQQGGQRVLAVELRPAGANFEATLILPFGLALDKGATLQIDDGQATQPYRFRTCLPGGCLVPLTFDPAYMTALQKGSVLKIKAVADSGADTPLSISLRGFGAAAARLTALSK
ncbi:invasion associated locus B family protein [Shinella sp. NM-101]|uniref:invasion associated locus B family protein n=1 Tax=Shinella sp. NM-101 TaxID=2744455 RepID=UPI001F32B692|nr:invasion associated locus B family protein [Shinella sp. NM-101]